MPSEHPNHDALRAYLKAELPPQQAAEMEAHLAGCDACVDVLAGLSEHEGIERRLKGLADAPARDSAAERRFLEELKARGPAEAARSPEASDQPTEAFPAAEQAVRLKCPHCGHGIQLVAPAPGEITCESCGSSFRVESAIAIAAPTGELPQTIGKFEILEQLGRGAFGAVYKARDRDLDRIVAVKVPRAGTFDTPEAEERFVREARSAAHLRHHNIVQVHEIAYERGVPYIVSEFIEGRTLADLVTAGRPGFRETAEGEEEKGSGLGQDSFLELSFSKRVLTPFPVRNRAKKVRLTSSVTTD
jgi:ribosomal protein S27E